MKVNGAVRSEHDHAVKDANRKQPQVEVPREEHDQKWKEREARDPAPQRQPLLARSQHVQASEKFAPNLPVRRHIQIAVTNEAVRRRLQYAMEKWHRGTH